MRKQLLLFGIEPEHGNYRGLVKKSDTEGLLQRILRSSIISFQGKSLFPYGTVLWDSAPLLERMRLAMNHILFRVSVYDKEKVVAMTRMTGELGLIPVLRMWWSDPNINIKESVFFLYRS